MSKASYLDTHSGSLVKSSLADRLRDEIGSGALRPGMRIVEGTWGRKFGVAQGSIREAINILAQEGFVTKLSGRSARVVSLSEHDVLQLYEIRGALEGLAARLASERHADVIHLEEAITGMRRASQRNRTVDLVRADCAFHLELCRLSGNAHLVEHASRVLLPFFAFVRLRVIASQQNTSAWDRDLEAHQRIADLIREGASEVAELYVRRVMARFAETAYGNWEKTPQQAVRRSRRLPE